MRGRDIQSRQRPKSADAATRHRYQRSSSNLKLDLQGAGVGEIELGRSSQPLGSPRDDSLRLISTTSPAKLSRSAAGSYYNQHLFNRLHYDATLKQKKLDMIRTNADREIKENSIFRSTSSLGNENREQDRFRYTNPDTRLYESGQLWAKKRDEKLMSLLSTKQAEGDKEESEICTFQPLLHSKQQPKRYETKREVFEALYESRNHYNKRAMERKWAHASGQMDTDLYFSPRSFAPKSSELAQKYRKEREEKILSAIGNMAMAKSRSGNDDNLYSSQRGRMSLNEIDNSKRIDVNTEHIQVSDEDLNNNLTSSNNKASWGNSVHNLTANEVNVSDGANNAIGKSDIDSASENALESRTYGYRSRSPSVGSTGGGHSVGGRSSSAVSLLTTSSRGGVRRYNFGYSSSASARGRKSYSNFSDFERNSFGGDGLSVPSQPQTIHDSLYLEARIDRSIKQNNFRRSIGASSELTHNPNIGVNHYVMTEVDRDSFFQRLYDHRLVVERVRQMNDLQFYSAEMGRNPELDRKITKEEEKKIVDKFAVKEVRNRAIRQQLLQEKINKEYEKAVYSSAPHHLDMMSASIHSSSSRSALSRPSLDDSHLVSSSISTSITSISDQRRQRSLSAPRNLTDKKSEKIAQVSRRRALCELFEILKMSEDYHKQDKNIKVLSATNNANIDQIDQIEQSLNIMTILDKKSGSNEEKSLGDESKNGKTKEVSSTVSSNVDDATSASVTSNQAIARDKVDGSLLDPCLAQAHIIKPAALAEVIGSLLASVAPTKLTLQSFIQLIESYIEKPNNRPISVYLTAPCKKYRNDNIHRIGYGNERTALGTKASGDLGSSASVASVERKDINRSTSRDRAHSRDRFSMRDRVQHNIDEHLKGNTLSSDDRMMLEVKSKPDLRARHMTERLIQDRYQKRILGQQTVHDSLRSYMTQREMHLDNLRKQADAEEMKECTFTPRLAAKDTYKLTTDYNSPLKYNQSKGNNNYSKVT